MEERNTNNEWAKLEDLIDGAIIEEEPYLAFKTINREECKYIQKVAENRQSKLTININAMTFFVAFGLSLTLPFIYEKSLDKSSNSIIVLLGFIIGIIILIYGIYFVWKIWTPRFDTCNKIILNAERRLQSEDIIEPKKTRDERIIYDTQIEDFDAWIKGLDKNQIEIWRESMAQLRHLTSDFWRSARFFISINGLVFAAIIANLSLNRTLPIVLLFYLSILAGFIII